MSFYAIGSGILTMAILATYINERFIKMPTTIAIMASSLLLSLLLILFGGYFFRRVSEYSAASFGNAEMPP